MNGFSRLGLCIAAAAAVLLDGCGHPSDSRLETIFHEHEAQFATILDMVRQDRSTFTVLWLDSHGVSPKHAVLPAERWQAYEQVCGPIGISRISFVNGQLELMVSTMGLLGRGSAKGFVYSESPLSPSLPSLPTVDHGLFANPPGTAYKALASNWYLFYFQTD